MNDIKNDFAIGVVTFNVRFLITCGNAVKMLVMAEINIKTYTSLILALIKVINLLKELEHMKKMIYFY